MHNYNNDKLYDNFTIVDYNGDYISGLNDSDFSYRIFDPIGDNVSLSINVVVKELGYGNYRICFTPNKIGSWYLIIYNEKYFPWGKAASFNIEKKLKTRIKP